MKPKSFLESSSVRGSLVAIVALVVGVVVPPVANIAARHLPSTAQDIRDVERLLIGLTQLVTGGGALAAIAGRVNVGDLYTPKGLPGPDKEDLVKPEPPRSGILSKLINF